MLPGEDHLVSFSLGLCRWYVGVKQTLHFDLNTSFAFLILARHVVQEGSKVQNQIPGMKDYKQIKHILKERAAPSRNIEETDTNVTQAVMRPSLSSKLPVKRKLDVSLLRPSDDWR